MNQKTQLENQTTPAVGKHEDDVRCDVNGDTSEPTVNTTTMNSSVEQRVLKLCLGLTCLFAICFSALLVRINLNLPIYFDYIYALNHVGNPVIYCLVSKTYYQEVMASAKQLLQKIKTLLLVP